MKAPVRVAVTGAAGQIGYALLFRIASGEMLGKDQPVILQLLDLPQAQNAVKGVMMELQDCAFPLLAGMVATDDPEVAFKDAQVAILVGARPRSKGMERADLLAANAEIFTVQGAALNKVADREVKVLVVGNPANTNAYIAMKSAPDLNPNNFTAMLRLDHNRALSQVAEKTGKAVGDIQKLLQVSHLKIRDSADQGLCGSTARADQVFIGVQFELAGDERKGGDSGVLTQAVTHQITIHRGGA